MLPVAIPMPAPTVTWRPSTRKGARSASVIRWATRTPPSRGAFSKQHGELVPTQPGDRVGGAKRAANPIGHRSEQPVTGGMIQSVAQGLEAVEIEEQDGDRALLRSPRARA
jgi:hypothetical protein